MANTKYLNQLELTGTFTPSNTAIVAGDNGQVIAQKTQGQINAITPPTLPISLANGGTNANLTASNGGIFYSTASAGAILSGTTTASQALLSGASTTPTWSTATYPATTTANQILYSSAANVVGGLTTANSAVLVTSSGGAPSLSTTLPAVAAGSCTCTDPTTSSSASINTALSDVYNKIPSFTTTTAASGGQTMAVNTSWQSVTAASITVGAGTYIITYTCSLYVYAAGAGGPSIINLETRLYNTTAGSTAGNSTFTHLISLSTSQFQGACNSFTGVFVISGSTNFIVQVEIDSTVLVGGFGAQNTVVTALKIA